jgi:hypothetical protein
VTRIATPGATPEQAAAIVAALDALAAPGGAPPDGARRRDRDPILRLENARWDVLRAAYRAQTRGAR